MRNMKQNITIILFFILLFSLSSIGQNIIPNGSFETYTACPNGANSNSPDEVKKASGWYTIKQTPDFFHTCATTSIVGVPSNFLGNQTPASGNAYTGLWAYQSSNLNFREILAAKLTTTLVIGQKYFIKLTVSLAEGYNSNCGIDKIGLRFSTVPHSLTVLPPINNFSHLYFTTIMADTLNWKSIFTAFVADSSYKYVEIGNFFNDANTNLQVVKPGAYWSYYYIDDICLSTDSLEALGFNATSIIEDIPNFSRGLFFPNPTTTKTASKIDLSEFDVKLFDVYGNTVKNFSISKENIIEFENISPGIYFIQLRKNQKICTEKIIINN
jgi:hypothetical protein